jgi:hypothetical protein
MQTKTITLPLPDARLSPNKKVHYHVKAPITKAHRQTAAFKTNIALLKGDKIYSYRLWFFWPNKIRRDKDNASSSCKAYMDGVSDAINQDDSDFEFDGVRFAVDKENPRVEIRVVLKETGKESWHHDERP